MESTAQRFNFDDRDLATRASHERWYVLRIEDLDPDQRRLVRALVAMMKAGHGADTP